jgi:hypothetical protein
MLFQPEQPLLFKKQPKLLLFLTIRSQFIRITFRKSFPTFCAIDFSQKKFPIATSSSRQFLNRRLSLDSSIEHI